MNCSGGKHLLSVSASKDLRKINFKKLKHLFKITVLKYSGMVTGSSAIGPLAKPRTMAERGGVGRSKADHLLAK